MNTIKKFITVGALAIFLLGMMQFAIPAMTVHAQSPADDTVPPEVDSSPAEQIPPAGEGGKLQHAALERLFKRAEFNHENQSKVINQADKLGNRIAEIIARAKENGKDTAVLEKALADFNEIIGEARLKFDQTGKLIKLHAGFDAEGKVVDAEAARTTLEQIHTGNKEVRQTVGDALKGLRGAGKAFREANPRPANSPTATPA
jgi:hypothetical protein